LTDTNNNDNHELQQSETQYRRLVETSPDMVLLCDEAGVILYINLAGTEMLGYESPESLRGHRLDDILHPDSKFDVARRIRELVERTQDFPFVEERLLRADGSALDVDMMAFPFFHQEKYVVHLIIRDITARKRAQAAQGRLRRRYLLTAAVLAIIAFFVSGYHLYHFSESIEFCGVQCHSVMQAEYRLHARSSHSHVTCAECHIGAGASWFVKSKLSGLHQVYAVLAKTYSRPISTPIENLRPAVETCEYCHSPKVFHGNEMKVFRSIPSDGRVGDPEVSAVLLKIGGFRPESGAFSGIHWHASQSDKVEYRALDRQRLKIRDIRVTRGGKVTTYERSDLPELPADAPWREMDCSDCHNRVPHTFQTVEQSVDELFLDGRLDRTLPDGKAAALYALDGGYAHEQAHTAIRSRLAQYYQGKHPEWSRNHDGEIRKAADTLYTEAYSRNVFPANGIKWGTYPDHRGHQGDAGCFRCHDQSHQATDGRTISQDCELCHSVVLQKQRESRVPEALRLLLLHR